MTHGIENHVKVYLRLNEVTNRWEVDPVTVDGMTLDGRHGGAGCVYSHATRPDEWAECQELLDNAPVLPTGEQVYLLLGASLVNEADEVPFDMANLLQMLEQQSSLARWALADEHEADLTAAVERAHACAVAALAMVRSW